MFSFQQESESMEFVQLHSLKQLQLTSLEISDTAQNQRLPWNKREKERLALAFVELHMRRL